MDGSFPGPGTVDGTAIPSLETLAYELTVLDGPGPWQVREVQLREHISRPYELVLDLATEDAEIALEQLLGASVVLTMSRVSVARRVAGIVARVERRGFQIDRLHVRLRIVPALALLEQRVASRIYQDLAVDRIVSDVLERGLGPYGRRFRFELARPLPVRDYCVQYRESDLDFVMRLLEEEGISYVFEHEGEAETTVMVDTNEPYPAVDTMDGLPVPTVSERPDLHEVESLQALEVGHQLHGTATEVIDFDFLDPLVRPTTRRPGTDARGRTRERYDHAERRFVLDLTQVRADHHLESDAARGEVWRGSSNVCGLAPGVVFEQAEGGRRFVVTAISHLGVCDEDDLAPKEADGGQERYRNELECVPVDVPIRPRQATPRPRVGGPETAIVTGPAGEEIHTDEHGRIKVHFHWDREQPYDEGSSCWVRVTQAWAGAGWGSLFIPRVGMEVVVNFLEGNPDRPLVVGCVYNGDNPLPYALPGDKTKSTLKSRSSLGGGGFNELRFEDLAGSEQVFLHAQRDLDEVVLNDHTLTVGNNETISIAVDQVQTIGNTQTESVGVSRTTQIGTEDALTVGAAQTISVGADRSSTVGGSDSLTAGAMVSMLAGGTITLTAGVEIVLQAGPSTITLGPTGITLLGPLITLN
ncbi:MAG: type VI secretion system tip protein VgrG [Deltaproteobacteria bacterium]|nr:type VI secretion system tip protein VgrG [Deltaproteobacteria bacterium]